MNLTDVTSRYLHRVRKRREDQITRIVIHHDAGRQPSSPVKVLTRLDSYHKQHDEVGGLPYHYVIDPWGKVYKCRRTTAITAHARNNNTPSLAVMLMGCFHRDNNFAGEHPTDAQLNALDELIPVLASAIPTVKFLTPHKDCPGSRTACPGNLFDYGRLDALRTKLGLSLG